MPVGAGRQFERLSVPVEHVLREGEAEDVAATAGIKGFDREPADFGFGVGIHRGADGFGEQLSPEPQAENPGGLPRSVPDEIEFTRKPVVPGVVVDARGTAHHDQEVHARHRAQSLAEIDARDVHLVPCGEQPRHDRPSALEINALQNVRPHPTFPPDAGPSSFSSFLVSPATVRLWQGGSGRQHASLNYQREGTTSTHRTSGPLGMALHVGLQPGSPNGDSTY